MSELKPMLEECVRWKTQRAHETKADEQWKSKIKAENKQMNEHNMHKWARSHRQVYRASQRCLYAAAAARSLSRSLSCPSFLSMRCARARCRKVPPSVCDTSPDANASANVVECVRSFRTLCYICCSSVESRSHTGLGVLSSSANEIFRYAFACTLSHTHTNTDAGPHTSRLVDAIVPKC